MCQKYQRQWFLSQCKLWKSNGQLIANVQEVLCHLNIEDRVLAVYDASSFGYPIKNRGQRH